MCQRYILWLSVIKDISNYLCHPTVKWAAFGEDDWWNPLSLGSSIRSEIGLEEQYLLASLSPFLLPPPSHFCGSLTLFQRNKTTWTLLSGRQTVGPFVCQNANCQFDPRYSKLFWVINRGGKYLSFLGATKSHVVTDLIWAPNGTLAPLRVTSPWCSTRSRPINFALRGGMWGTSSQNRCYVVLSWLLLLSSLWAGLSEVQPGLAVEANQEIIRPLSDKERKPSG